MPHACSNETRVTLRGKKMCHKHKRRKEKRLDNAPNTALVKKDKLPTRKEDRSQLFFCCVFTVLVSAAEIRFGSGTQSDYLE